MATVTEMREWLAAHADEHGEEVPARGRLNDRLTQIYTDAHSDYEGGVTEADFTSLDDEPDSPPAEVQAEKQPARPRRARSRPAGGSVLGRVLADRKQQGKRKRKQGPRTPLDKLATRGYMRLGQIMQGISPPTGRCLQAQAAMAGVMLEDILKGTVADRILQPVARATDKLDKGFALLAPPAIVFALDVLPVDETPQNMMRRGLLMAMLRESLIISLEVSADYADRVAENLTRHAEAEAEVDKLLTLIFEGMPAPAPDMAAA
jgi:hypothetical protein